MSPARTSGQQAICGSAIAALLALLLATATPLAAATFTGSPLDLERIATTLRERGAVEIDVPGALALSGEWSLPEGTIDIRAGGSVVADGWHLVSPGSRLTLNGSGVHLRGRTQIDVAKRGGRAGSVALMGGQGTVEIDDGAAIDASGDAGQGGQIHLAANDVLARGELLALGQGLVEVDARRGLRFLSHTNTGGGLVRLDPTNVVIKEYPSDANTDVTITNPAPPTPRDISPNNPPNDGQLDASGLATMLGANNIIVHTTGDANAALGLQSVITGDTNNGDISIEAPVVWTSQFSLTLLAHDDLIVLANVENDKVGLPAGNLIGVSGWNGSTLSGFAGLPLSYGVTGGDTFIYGAQNPSPADNGVAFGSRDGSTEIWAYNLTVHGSTGPVTFPTPDPLADDGFAMVGFRVYDGTTASGSILVTTHNDVSLVGGGSADPMDDTDRFAQIGHGGLLRKVDATLYTHGNQQGDLSGSIGVHAEGALTLDDGTHYAYTQIGHGGLIFQGHRNNLSGDIDVSAKAMTITADFWVVPATPVDSPPRRPAGYSMIGHGGLLSSGYNEESIANDYDGAITVSATSLTMTAGTMNSSAAQIGHGGYVNWSDDGPTVLGNIGSHVAGGAPITVTVTGDIKLQHVLKASSFQDPDGTAQIGHGGPVFGGTVGSILGNITVHSTAGSVLLTGGGNCRNGCGSQIGHSSMLNSFFNIDAGPVRGDITVTADGTGTVQVVGGGATNGGGQYEWAQIGHGGPMFGVQAFNGGVADQYLHWGGVPAAGADTNDVTVTGAHVLVQGGKGATAAAQIGNGGFIFQFNAFGTMHVGPFDGKVTVTATTGDLQVLAGTDPGGNDVAFGTAYAQVGNGGQNFSLPAGVPAVTEDGASGAIKVTVAQETSLTNDAGGSMWWLGHRTRGPLSGAPVQLDTGTLDFAAGHTGGATATISDATFWSRFVVPPTLTGPEKRNAQGGEVTLRAHGPSGANGNVISAQPLTVPGAITNAVHVLSTDDLTLNSPVTNNSLLPVDLDFVADDANPAPTPPPGWSTSALLNIGVGGAPVGPVRLFAVAPAQFVNLSGYVPPNQQFGVWYQVAGTPVVGANFKAVVTPVELLELEVQ